MSLCGGYKSIDADSATSAFAPVGFTTISGTLIASGCSAGLHIIAQGCILGCPAIVLPDDVKSPDINGDLFVDIIDLALIPPVYLGTQPYTPCVDYDCNGTIGLIDYAYFGVHYLHRRE